MKILIDDEIYIVKKEDIAYYLPQTFQTFMWYAKCNFINFIERLV